MQWALEHEPCSLEAAAPLPDKTGGTPRRCLVVCQAAWQPHRLPPRAPPRLPRCLCPSTSWLGHHSLDRGPKAEREQPPLPPESRPCLLLRGLGPWRMPRRRGLLRIIDLMLIWLPYSMCPSWKEQARSCQLLPMLPPQRSREQAPQRPSPGARSRRQIRGQPWPAYWDCSRSTCPAKPRGRRGRKRPLPG